MSMADFVEFKFPETGEVIYLNVRYIIAFKYDHGSCRTSVQIQGDQMPYTFPGDVTSEIRAAINRLE